jgi:hypothetical protein
MSLLDANIQNLTQEDINRLVSEASTKAAVQVTRIIPAGETVGMEAYGRSFYVLKANAELEINTDLTAPKVYKRGKGENFPELFRFKRLEVKNTAAFAVTVTLWIGFGEYIDKNVDVSENPSALIGIGFTSIAASPGPGNSVTLTGAPPSANYLRRKSVIITNLDPANFLEYTDGTNAAGVVFARVAIELTTSGPVTITNTTGAAISYRLSEIWYTA